MSNNWCSEFDKHCKDVDKAACILSDAKCRPLKPTFFQTMVLEMSQRIKKLQNKYFSE